MAIKTIARVDGKLVWFQAVTLFSRIQHSDLARQFEIDPETTKKYSDFNSSGDSLRVNFEHEIETITFDFEYCEFGINLGFSGDIPSHKINSTLAAIKLVKSMELKADKKSREWYGNELRWLTREKKLKVLFELFKVQGGTNETPPGERNTTFEYFAGARKQKEIIANESSLASLSTNY